jgi:hypothetical protein
VVILILIRIGRARREERLLVETFGAGTLV